MAIWPEVNAGDCRRRTQLLQDLLRASNAVLTIAGDVDVNEVKQLVEKHFAGIPRKPPADTRLERAATKLKRENFATDKLANTPALATAITSRRRTPPDFPRWRCWSRFCKAMTARVGSKRLVKEKELTWI